RRGCGRLRPHQGGARRGAGRHAPGTGARGRADDLRVAWDRGRGPRVRRAHRAPGARAGGRRRGSVLTPLADIEAARERIAGTVIRTPLVRLRVDAPAEIWLKLENLQPIASFKLRGAANAVLSAPPEALRDGLVTT